MERVSLEPEYTSEKPRRTLPHTRVDGATGAWKAETAAMRERMTERKNLIPRRATRRKREVVREMISVERHGRRGGGRSGNGGHDGQQQSVCCLRVGPCDGDECGSRLTFIVIFVLVSELDPTSTSPWLTHGGMINRKVLTVCVLELAQCTSPGIFVHVKSKSSFLLLAGENNNIQPTVETTRPHSVRGAWQQPRRRRTTSGRGKPLKARSSPGHRLSEHPTEGRAWMGHLQSDGRALRASRREEDGRGGAVAL